MELSTLVEGGHFFEGPRWHDGTWWVSDFYAHHVLTLTPDGAVSTVMEVPGQPSGLGWMPDGSLLVVSMRDHRILRRDPDGTVTEHADISAHCGGKANDMIVDAAGRAFAGNFGFDLMAGADPATSTLIRVDPDGSVHVAASDMYFPNGSVILPDGITLVVGETMGCRYTAFTIGADGQLTDRRVWAQLAPTPALGTLAETLGAIAVGPDGCSLDAEDRIWAADALGARVIRIAEGGEILEEIAMPGGLGAFACQLGGEDGRTLLICAAPDFAEHQRQVATEAVLLTTRVAVPHAGLP
ncbi:MAG TPA: SMP-30/gluconolactonase/LRE family protein [Euzebya sp.]|nr:SMP-30/gluconolactonase/LRE family protein [Euzebya sp.]